MNQTTFSTYLHALETLSADDLDVYTKLMAVDARFTDPFQSVQGRQAIADVFAHMFNILDGVRFHIRHHAISDTGVGLIVWDMVGTWRKSGKAWELRGMSEITFNSDGLAACHVDYWDAAQGFYEGLPVLGAVLRAIRRRVARISQQQP